MEFQTDREPAAKAHRPASLELKRRHLFPNYRPQPVTFVRGVGSRLYDSMGRDYVDLVAGIATCSLGHCHPKLVASLERQGRALWHVSNLYDSEPAGELARRLCETSFAERVFFCNSGAEANEAAIKLARRVHHDRGAPRSEILVFHNSFHGRTMGALSATAQPKYHLGFEPLVPGFVPLPYGDASAVENVISERTAAILVEPIQGEGGVVVPPPDFLPRLRKAADSVGALLIFDEVQTGMGRTGTLWAYEQAGVRPDILTSAKALGGGFPIGALLSTDALAASFVPGTHASTFGGNPLATGVASTVLSILLDDGVLTEVRARGERLQAAMKEALPKGFLRGIRGRGLLLALEIDGNAPDIARRALEAGVLVNALGDQLLRLVPALNLSDLDIEVAAQRLAAACRS